LARACWWRVPANKFHDHGKLVSLARNRSRRRLDGAPKPCRLHSVGEAASGSAASVPGNRNPRDASNSGRSLVPPRTTSPSPARVALESGSAQSLTMSKRKKRIEAVGLALVVASAACREKDPNPGAWSDTGRGIAALSIPAKPIRSEAEALRIGEEVLVASFGRTNVNQERPLLAHLDSSVWTVSGALPKNRIGGVGTVLLSAQDGHLIRVFHTQ